MTNFCSITSYQFKPQKMHRTIKEVQMSMQCSSECGEWLGNHVQNDLTMCWVGQKDPTQLNSTQPRPVSCRTFWFWLSASQTACHLHHGSSVQIHIITQDSTSHSSDTNWVWNSFTHLSTARICLLTLWLTTTSINWHLQTTSEPIQTILGVLNKTWY